MKADLRIQGGLGQQMTRPEHWWLTSARFNTRLQISFAAEFENSKCYSGAGICRLDLRAADGKSRSSITRFSGRRLPLRHRAAVALPPGCGDPPPGRHS